MQRINFLFTLSSLIAFLIIIERLSPTTKIFLQPYNFIRLHEVDQIVIFLSASVILSFLMLQQITNNFQTLKEKGNAFLALCFVAGTYLFGAGEGWHELANVTFNTSCQSHFTSTLCQGLFINDYFVGNILFFAGGVLMNTSLLTLSLKHSSKRFDNKNMIILLLNSIVYAFTWFAYAAFDRVLIGLIFSTLLFCIATGFYWKIRTRFREYPYITYSVVAYTLATVATLLAKFH